MLFLLYRHSYHAASSIKSSLLKRSAGSPSSILTPLLSTRNECCQRCHKLIIRCCFYGVLNHGIDYEYYGISFHNCLSIWSQGIEHAGSIRLRSSAIDRRDRNRSQTVADACFHMIEEPTILRWSAIIWKPGFSSGSIVPTDLGTETGYCNFQRCTDSRMSFMD